MSYIHRSIKEVLDGFLMMFLIHPFIDTPYPWDLSRQCVIHIVYVGKNLGYARGTFKRSICISMIHILSSFIQLKVIHLADNF